MSTIDRFRALHASGCFLLPNPWDVGTAVYLESLGFQALATTSAGFAFTQALPDEVSALSCDRVLQHVAEIAAATSLPVNADFQNGYADAPEGVAANVVRCAKTGAAGLSIEDASGDPEAPLYERALAVDRVRAARDALASSGKPLVLTARCEAWLVGAADPARVAIDRLVAYAEAGADCLYAPGVRDPETIAALVKAVAPKPLNVLVTGPDPALTPRRLADLGVRRISVGSALARVAWGAFLRAARVLAERGTFDGFEGAARSPDPDDVFLPRARR